MSQVFTPEQIIRLGQGVERFLKDEHVQQVWEALDEIYYTNWKAAVDPAERELLWAKVSALGELRQKLEQTVQVGQDHAILLERAEAESS